MMPAEGAYSSFETERLILKPTDEEDAAFILQLFNTPQWLRYIGDRNLRSLKDARNYISERIRPQFKSHGFSTYTVIGKQHAQKMGTCGLYDREGIAGIDIGFAFLPRFEGYGFAFEASNRLKCAAFDHFGLTRLSAITTECNLRSQKLLTRIGLKAVGTTRLPDDSKELILYRLEK